MAAMFPFCYNCLSCLYMVVEPSYLIQMCSDTHTEITSVLWLFPCDIFQFAIHGFFNSDLSELLINLDLCYTDLTCYPDIILHLFAK